MNYDPFEEYIRHKEPGKAEKGYAWQTAIGLQAVDGIKTSDYNDLKSGVHQTTEFLELFLRNLLLNEKK